MARAWEWLYPDNAGAVELTPIQILIGEFRLRSRRRRLTAGFILLIIVALLVGGTSVFVLAPQVTLGDFATVDIDADITALIREKEAVLDRQAKAVRAYDNWLDDTLLARKRYYGIVSEILEQFKTARAQEQVTWVIADKDLDQPRTMIATLNNIDKTDPRPVRVNLSALKVGAQFFYIPSAKVGDVAAAIATKVDLLKPLPDAPQTGATVAEREKLNFLDRSIERLRDAAIKRHLQSLGEEGSEKGKPAPDMSVAQVIQTNIVRFGTIVVILLLILVLTPIYRYNSRLATFYDARADILELQPEKFTELDGLKLAAAFTPTFDAGKAPPGSG